MASLSDYVCETVSPKDYYSGEFPKITWPGGGTEPRVMCVFHKDNHTPSLHFNPENGKFFCHGCKARGNDIVSFHAQRYDLERRDAAAEIFHTFIHPTIGEAQIVKWHKRLLSTPTALAYIQSKARMLKLDVIKQYKIGYDGFRFTIPIYNEFEVCVNVKLYDPYAKKHGTYKIVNYKAKEDSGETRPYGKPPMLFPLHAIDMAKEKSYVVVCEGEWDALFLLGVGLPAVTTTAGSKSWPKQYNQLFRGLRVIIAYDNDQDGMKYDREVVLPNIQKFAKKVKRLDIPKLVRGHKTKDVTEWAANNSIMRDKVAWLNEFKKAKTLISNSDEYIAQAEVQDVPLDQASRAEWFNKPIRVPALITGKDLAPYILPMEYRVKCDKKCDDCPLVAADKDYRETKIDPQDPRILNIIDVTQTQQRRMLLQQAGFSEATPGCNTQIEVTKTFNLEQLILIPTLDSKTAQYVTRTAYYVGHGLHSNRAYNFHGTTIPHPEDQHATHLFTSAKPVQDEIENFELTEDTGKRLVIFQPKSIKLMAHLMSLAEWQSRNVTKIRERPDLHIAVDLVFHSVAAFDFNGEYQSRGMLDALIIGDTRCGKGYVTEGLIRYYGLGELASGENCTFAGLVGGLQQIGKRWLVTWGLIPLNDRRMVVIDEASSLSVSEIGHMSRVRSEGVAEISKIVRESTQANTRLIWLSNPRSGRPIMTYNAGVEAIKELVGANEDISRFDFALTVATNEVPSEIINAPLDTTNQDAEKFPRDLCRSLVLWAWSRRPDQIQFTPDATEEIIRQAVDFGHTYSAAIPLVQAENIRIKIAKISAAVAARVFSTDANFQNLVVRGEHVRCACHFLNMAYGKQSMAYDAFSETAIASSTIKGHAGPIERLFNQLGKDRDHTINGLLQLHRVTADTLGDYVGDVSAAKGFIGDLVKLQCLSRMELGNGYLKNPDFSAWLRAHRNETFSRPLNGKARPINGKHTYPGSKVHRGRSRAD